MDDSEICKYEISFQHMFSLNVKQTDNVWSAGFRCLAPVSAERLSAQSHIQAPLRVN